MRNRIEILKGIRPGKVIGWELQERNSVKGLLLL